MYELNEEEEEVGARSSCMVGCCRAEDGSGMVRGGAVERLCESHYECPVSVDSSSCSSVVQVAAFTTFSPTVLASGDAGFAWI